jgi:cystathionine gamma-synthase/methionine-gamma-lyase
MSALNMALVAVLLDRPKRVLAADAMYGTTTFMLMNIFSPMGVEPSFANAFDVAEFEEALVKTKPGAVVVETISNPLLRVAPLDDLGHIARKHEVPLIVDNTFATPLLVRPLELGASMVIHSATKYLAGHGDVLGGVIVADEPSYQALRPVARTLGPVLGPFDCYLTMRGIKTLALRMERQCANACKVAQKLAGHSGIERVYFPGDAGHADAATAARLFPKGLAGGLVAFEIKGANRKGVMSFMNRLKMIVRGTSLGDVHTMILYPAMASHRDISPKQRERMGIRDNLVRMSIGIEAVEDIIGDLEQALEG